ncbi:hypothetical protein JCM10908_005460 [Rhodotorula pacifica]|uniref:uncharacterized protein n=1 Tax=Rhodotorula pacifica TaxID=1495444 RepID=UPI00317E9335
MFRLIVKTATSKSFLPRAHVARRSFFMPPAYPTPSVAVPSHEPRNTPAVLAAGSHSDASPGNANSGTSEDNLRGPAHQTEASVVFDSETAQYLGRIFRYYQAGGQTPPLRLDDPSGLASSTWIGSWLKEIVPTLHTGSADVSRPYELRKEEWSDMRTGTDQRDILLVRISLVYDYSTRNEQGTTPTLFLRVSRADLSS